MPGAVGYGPVGRASLEPRLAAGGPGVYGLVGVHVLDVALGHLAQRLDAIRAALADRRDRVRLPGRPVLAGDAALLDDAEQPVGQGRVGAPAGEPLLGEWQQTAQHQFDGWHLAKARPVQ